MDSVLDHPTIGDYALIGDCRAAALVSRSGGLDWLCLPHFDSPSLFAALLDRARGGSWSVRPTADFTVERRYLPGTNVLETTFRTASGTVRLTDLMPVASPEERRRELTADREVLRRVEGVDGEVEVETVWDPRFDYGRAVPTPVERGALGWMAGHAARVAALRSEVPVEPRPEGGLVGRATLAAGDRRFLSLSFTGSEPAVLPPLGDAAAGRLETSVRWWRGWAGHCAYDGPFRQAVLRSALVLKLMSFAPSGGIAAAPTSSLPEHVGGRRNWDYRFCWLRDASFTLRALLDLGYHDEARAFLDWFLNATRVSYPRLNVVYDVYGRAVTDEEELTHLDGYRGSRPVRRGNGAAGQVQLDLYGEVIGGAFEYVQRGGTLDRAERRLLVALGETVVDRWQEPDRGIWEVRGGDRPFTYSKVHCWLALDRLLKLSADGVLAVPEARFRDCRAAIGRQVERRGFSERLGSYTSVFDTEVLDASLLLFSVHGYRRPDDPRIAGTFARVVEHLGSRGLLYRYREDFDDGMEEPEGAFGACGFWAVEHQAMAGDREAAERSFGHQLGFANDLGLFSEEIDPESGELLGNFPQAFTHVAVINAAMHLADPALGPEGERW